MTIAAYRAGAHGGLSVVLAHELPAELGVVVQLVDDLRADVDVQWSLVAPSSRFTTATLMLPVFMCGPRTR